MRIVRKEGRGRTGGRVGRAKMHAYVICERRLFRVMLPFSSNVYLFGVIGLRACLLESE